MFKNESEVTRNGPTRQYVLFAALFNICALNMIEKGISIRPVPFTAHFILLADGGPCDPTASGSTD